MNTITWTGMTDWYVNPSQKCPNCGYCKCCGKADIPGLIMREDRALPGGRGVDNPDVHDEPASGE